MSAASPGPGSPTDVGGFGPGRAGGSQNEHEGEAPGLVIRDKRRIDPETGGVRTRDKEASMADDTEDTMAQGDDAVAGAVGDDRPGAGNGGAYQGRHSRSGADDAAESGDGSSGRTEEAEARTNASAPTSPARGSASAAAARAAYASAPKGRDPGVTAGASAAAAADEPATAAPGAPAGDAQPAADRSDAVLAAERLTDLQRLNAEYANYRRRVDRERALDKDRTVAELLESMLPVLDEIYLARQHGELAEDGPFAKIAAKLEGVLHKYGVERYGEAGEAFDPMVHEAVMHTQADLPEGTTETTITQIMQPGYRVGHRVVRAALVAVADPR